MGALGRVHRCQQESHGTDGAALGQVWQIMRRDSTGPLVRRNSEKSAASVMDEKGAKAAAGTEVAEALHEFFASGFAVSHVSHISPGGAGAVKSLHRNQAAGLRTADETECVQSLLDPDLLWEVFRDLKAERAI